MAQSANQLTISISADSSKLRADVALATAELRKLKKEEQEAARALAGGTGSAEALKEISTQADIAARKVKGLSAAYNEHNKMAAAAAREVGGISSAVDGLGAAAGRAQAAFRALFALQGMRQAANAVGDVYDEINKLNKEAAGTGFTPQGVATVKEILDDVGVGADASSAALSKFNEAVVASKEKMGLLKDGSNAAAAGINVMRGELSSMGDSGEVSVFRGDKKPIDDTTTAFGKLTTAMRGIGKSFNPRQWQTNEDRIKAVSGALADLTKVAPDVAASLGREIFGRNYAEMAKGILKIGEAWNQTQADLKKSGRMPSPDDDKKLAEYLAAVDAVGDAWLAAKKKSVLATHETTIAVLNAAADLVESAGKINDAFDKFIKDSGAPLGGNLVKNTLSEFDGLQTFFGTTLPDWVSRGYAAVNEAIANSGILARNQEELEKLKAAWSAFGTYLIEEVWALLPPAWQTTLQQLTTNATENLATLKTTFETIFADIRSAGETLFSWLGSKLSETSSALSSAYGSAGGVPLPAPGNAAGGLIRGPGSGTSDSILARLSDGEYVMRARAVQHWGPQFMAALNAMRNPFGYAGGGLASGRRVPRFAAGGMVTARTSDGTPVHLHIGGSSFALRGDKAIVESLTREARRASMLSGGRLPGAAFG